MPTIAAITRERHGDKRWKPDTSYRFAASEAVIPLVVHELPRAALALPIAFTTRDDHVAPVAVLGLAPGQNLLVGDDGRWVGGPYIPAFFRAHPFLLAPVDGRNVLAINEDIGLLTDGREGQPFFDEGGSLAKPVAEILSFLEHLSASSKATLQVCAVLKQHGLVQPWPITLKTPSGDQHVEGLARIDEAALNALPGAAFLEVRQAGGLAVAYCQLLSMQHISGLVQLAAARAENRARKLPVNQAGELDLEFLNDGPLMDFSKMK